MFSIFIKSLKNIFLNYQKFIFFIGFFLLLISFYFLFFSLDNHYEKALVKEEEDIERLSIEQIKKLQDGDIILRYGYGILSHFIAYNLCKNSSYQLSHAGILCKDSGHWKVIHSLSSEVSSFEGVQEQSLNDFLKYSQPQKILVVRLKNIKNSKQKSFCQRAQYYVQQKIPFDHQGNFEDSTKMYCTELIWHILEKDLKIITLPQNYQERENIYYSLSEFYNNSYFEIIINTFE